MPVPLVTRLEALHERRTFLSKPWDIRFHDRPDQGVVDGRIFVGQLISKIDDPASVGDRREGFGRDTGESSHSLANDNELALNGGANEPTPLVRCEIQVSDRRRDRVAGVHDVVQLGTRVTRHRAIASSVRSAGLCTDS